MTTRHHLAALLMSLLLGLMGSLSAETTDALPADAQRVLDQLDRDIVKLKERAAADLAKVVDKETKAGHLEEALAVRQTAESLKGEGVKQLKHPIASTIYVACDDRFELYLNEHLLLTGARYDQAYSIESPVQSGDVIVIKVINDAGAYGLAFAAKAVSGTWSVVSNLTDWKTFTPRNPERWYETKALRSTQLLAVTPGNSPITKTVVDEASSLASEVIWGTGDTTYLVYVVK